jgi:parallel beta-helix repeat protein
MRVKMNKKSLILVSLLLLIVFLGTSAISAEEIADTDDTSISEVSEDNDIIASDEVTINTDDTNDQIQEKINGLKDGDTLNFQKGDYHDICIYINKSVTINGNGATLYGYDNPTDDKIPDIIMNTTSNGGYAITNKATLYILKTNGLVLKDLNIVAGANSGTDKGADSRYTNCVIYNYFSNKTTITNTTIDGCSWGIWLQNCNDGIIENNTVRNQLITGIFNFQSPRTIIRNNTVTNAKNHGIDVRHGVGPNVKVLNNTVIGSKEGIYLLHSKGHTVTGNTIINCSLSSITCCGASNINIENNKLQYSRIGVLLGGGAPSGGTYTGYNNITIGENEWKIDELPFPPSFEYYVAEAKANYATLDSMMGTHSDSSITNITYTEFKGIEVPGPIVIDYNTLLNATEKTVNITSGMTNTQIQAAIDGMNDGDTLVFEKNAVFEDVCIYIDKNIKVIGNNATLKSHDTVSQSNVHEKILNTTANGGYAISHYAVIYVVNNTNAVISNLNIKCNYPGYDKTKVSTDTPEYYTAGIYGEVSKKLTITGCSIDGASWGIFLGGRDGKGCPNAIITNNKISNQYTTGILNFGGKESIIANNTVTNAVNHGIDVRFKSGSGVTVYNNTISGSKEGIYLLHSEGHKVYGNTILNSKISSITCYGSGNEYIFDNTLSGSRIAIILGGGYYNVTIGSNTFKPDKLPFPPTFEYFLVQSENKYYAKDGSKVVGTYKDAQEVNLVANDVTVDYETGEYNIKLTDNTGKGIANIKGTVTINNETYNITTNENGEATIALSLKNGTYTAITKTTSNYYYKSGYQESTIIVNPKTDDNPGGENTNGTTNGTGSTTPSQTQQTTSSPTKTTPKKVTITAKKKTFKAKTKVKKYTITLKSGKTLIKKAKVTLKIKGKTYKATTNAKGKATFKIKKLTKKGKYLAVIKYKGSSLYKAASKKVKITVKK